MGKRSSKASHGPSRVELRHAAGRNAQPALKFVAPAQEAQAPTLDDAAMLLSQLEVEDKAGFRRLQASLKLLIECASTPPEVREHLEKCREAAVRLGKANAGDAASAVSEIAQSLERAQNSLERANVAVVPESEIPELTHDREMFPMPPLDLEAKGGSVEPGESHGRQPCAPTHAFEAYLPPDADLDLLGEFINESREFIAGAEAALLLLETNPDDIEAINTVFRAFHTIKGTSGFLNLKPISQLAHRSESLLSRARDQEIRCTGGYADLALRSVDMLKNLVQEVQNALGGAPMRPPEGYEDLLILLADPEAAGVSDTYECVSEAVKEVPRLGDILVAEGTVTREEVEAVAHDQGRQHLGLALVQSSLATVAEVAHALRVQQQMSGGESRSDSSVRVSTERLDRLIDMVGELVIAQSIVAQDETVRLGGRHDLLKKVTHSGKIIRELQDLSMSMRMVPLRSTFRKMQRLARDLALKCGKKVNLVAEDSDAEIDRNMVDIINDILVHMVRNAVDHGIEQPEARIQAGKDPFGTVMLSAFHSGGSVVVEIRDDGKGLDRNRIVQRAISKGLLESDKGLSDNEVYHLIFAPGLSTAEQLTDISGRGVGMDVVKRGIESLRGRVDIHSSPGRGCTFSVQFPLTLAITDGMLVQVGREQYIIPTVDISVSFRPDPSALSTVAGRGEMVMLRDELLPLFRLHRLFRIADAVQDPTHGLLVVIGEGSNRCALLVDELLGQQQVVAKSLGGGIGNIDGIAGGAILGNGCVGLILDAGAIAALARQGDDAIAGTAVPRRSTHVPEAVRSAIPPAA